MWESLSVVYDAAILGTVQGITEFFPISSSGHLLVFHDVFRFDRADSLNFDAALHLGTLVALLIFFRQDVRRLVRGFFQSLRQWEVRTNADQRESWFVFVGALPAGIIGFFLEPLIAAVTRNAWIVVVTLTAGAGVFWAVERLAAVGPRVELTWRRVLLIGFVQILALIPGVSRSGATIIAGLGLRLNRTTAARYSFLVSLPVVAGAGAWKLVELATSELTSFDLLGVFIGIASAAIVGYLVIRYFLRFVQRHSLSVFAWYRVLAAMAIAVVLVIR